jgi:hypothetical protein
MVSNLHNTQISIEVFRSLFKLFQELFSIPWVHLFELMS